MLGWGKKPPAPSQNGGAGPETRPDVVSGFPRGLGDIHQPLATARWLSSTEAAERLGPWKPGRFLIGRDAGGRYIGFDDDRHILSVAGSRAGKGVSLIVPALTFWPGSVLAIDPKGELATITACRRSEAGSEWAVGMGGESCVLDPFRRVTGPAAALRGSFNPMADLDADAEEATDVAGQIADALVVQQEGAGSHWTQSARAFLRGLVLYVAKTQPPDQKSLIRVRELLLQSEEPFIAMLNDMGKYEGTIARASNSLGSKPREERASVISTCDVQTDFLESPAMKRVLTGTNAFRLEDMKKRRISVYLCLPATRLGTHGRWLRLMVGMALEAMEKSGAIEKGKPPVLFCLDEFAALGHMESVEKAAGQIAGFGVKLWPVIQDLTQLKRDYKEAWETFMGNAGLLTFFGNTDLTTLDHISRRLGECEAIRTVVNTSEGWQVTTGTNRPDAIAALAGQMGRSTSSGQTGSGQTSANQSLMKGPLMNPDEIARYFARDAGKILALIPGEKMLPAALHRCMFFAPQDDDLFGGLFDPADLREGAPLPRTKAGQRLARSYDAEAESLLKPAFSSVSA